jgi:hypothetical protein
MMLATTFLVVGAAVGLFRPDTISRIAIERELSTFVRVDTVSGPPGEGAVRVVGFNTDGHKAGPLLADFLHEHGRLVWYLATHTPGAQARMLTDRDSPLIVRDSVIVALQTNQIFSDRVFTMLAQYWRPRGRFIAGASPRTTRASVSVTSLTRIGARFFYPDRFSARGDTMFTHICAGMNGISDLPDAVDPLVEAFVFAAVSGSVFEPRSPLMRDFERAAKRAKVTSVSKDTATRVRRAQGAMWVKLEESSALRRVLTRAYSTHQTVLPFRLADGS